MPRRKTVGRKSSRGYQGALILKTGPKKTNSKVATMPRTKTRARKSGTGIAPVSNGTQPQLVLKTRAKKRNSKVAKTMRHTKTRNPVGTKWNYRHRRCVRIKSIRTAKMVQLKIQFVRTITHMTDIMTEASFRAERRKVRIQHLKRQIRENNGVCNDDPIDESGDEKQ